MQAREGLLRSPRPGTLRISDGFEERERTFLEQRCCFWIEVAEAAVGEQVALAWIEKQLGVLDLVDESAGGGDVLLAPFVVLHHVDLHGDAVRPGRFELRGRHARVEQQRSLSTGTRLGEHLRRHPTQREAGVDELGRQTLRSGRASFEDHVEADLPGVSDSVVEVRERLPVVQIGCVHHVARSAQLVGEREEALGLPLRVVEQQYLGHGRHSNRGYSENGSCVAPVATSQTWPSGSANAPLYPPHGVRSGGFVIFAPALLASARTSSTRASERTLYENVIPRKPLPSAGTPASA